ncbi:hypothetical protein GCM10009850_114350 [Nonomuraea monospora]|uniref:Uncharacterized protein n=2 Tax=Nonomuraea monospora TaxID=568818 RepID=A0ABN3D2C9_9ACTN
MWAGVFSAMERVKYSGLQPGRERRRRHRGTGPRARLPGRPRAPIRNMAVYRLHDGRRIVEWRDHTNAAYARTLM